MEAHSEPRPGPTWTATAAIKIGAAAFIASALLATLVADSATLSGSSGGLLGWFQAHPDLSLRVAGAIASLAALLALARALRTTDSTRLFWSVYCGLLLTQSAQNAYLAAGGATSGLEPCVPLIGLALAVHLQRRARHTGAEWSPPEGRPFPAVKTVAIGTLLGLLVGGADVIAGTVGGIGGELDLDTWLLGSRFALLAQVSFAVIVATALAGSFALSAWTWARTAARPTIDRALYATVPIVAGSVAIVVGLLYYGSHFEIGYPSFVPTIAQGVPWFAFALAVVLPLAFARVDGAGEVQPGYLLGRTPFRRSFLQVAFALGLGGVIGRSAWITYNVSGRQLGNDSYARILDCGLVFAIVICGLLLALLLFGRSGRFLTRPWLVRGIAGLGVAAIPFAAVTPPDHAAIGIRSYELCWGSTRILRGVTDVDRDGYSALFGDGDVAALDASISPATRLGLHKLYERTVGEPLGPVEDTLESFASDATELLSPRPKNLLVITVDALRADALGLYGAERPTSPFLDRWSQKGIVFERFYTPASSTHCALRSLSSGHLQGRLTYFNGLAAEVEFAPTIFEVAMKKNHFDHFIVHNINDGLPNDRVPEEASVEWFDPNQDAATIFETVGESVAALDRDDTFFAWVHLMDVHFPYVLDENSEYFGDDVRALYDSAIHTLDAKVEKFFARLEELGRLDDTLVVFSADHGVEFREHGLLYHGQQVYEESIRIPLVIAHPSLVPGRVSTPASLVDLAPTFAQIWGIEDPSLRYEGFSLVPYLLGRSDPQLDARDLVSISGRQDSWCLLSPDGWKILYARDSNSWELYHLPSDPHERSDRYLDEPVIASKLGGRLLRYMIGGYDRFGISHHWLPRSMRGWNRAKLPEPPDAAGPSLATPEDE